MATTLQELSSKLEDELSCASFQDGCVNGIQVEGNETINHLAFSVSSSLYAIEQSALIGADALIVHHGLFWKGFELKVTGFLRNRLFALLSSNMSLLAYHLPLDAHKELGNNFVAAKALGLKELSPFLEIGAIGIAEKKRDSFAKDLETYYEHPLVKAEGGGEKVHRVAIVSGGAYKLLKECKEHGVDTFVTGSFDEPAWHMAFEEGINFYAAGHAATEKAGILSLMHFCKNTFSVKTSFIDEKNPF